MHNPTNINPMLSIIKRPTELPQLCMHEKQLSLSTLPMSDCHSDASDLRSTPLHQNPHTNRIIANIPIIAPTMINASLVSIFLSALKFNSMRVLKSTSVHVQLVGRAILAGGCALRLVPCKRLRKIPMFSYRSDRIMS